MSWWPRFPIDDLYAPLAATWFGDVSRCHGGIVARSSLDNVKKQYEDCVDAAFVAILLGQMQRRYDGVCFMRRALAGFTDQRPSHKKILRRRIHRPTVPIADTTKRVWLFGKARFNLAMLRLGSSRYARSPTASKRSKSLPRQIRRKIRNQSGSVTSMTLSSGPCMPGVTSPK